MIKTVVLNAEAQYRPEVLLLALGGLHCQRGFQCLDALQGSPQPLDEVWLRAVPPPGYQLVVKSYKKNGMPSVFRQSALMSSRWLKSCGDCSMTCHR